MGRNGPKSGWGASTSVIVARLPVRGVSFWRHHCGSSPSPSGCRVTRIGNIFRPASVGGVSSDGASKATHLLRSHGAAFECIDEFRQIPTNLTKTNAYQRDQRQTNRIPKEIPVTPHALKLLERPIHDNGGGPGNGKPFAVILNAVQPKRRDGDSPMVLRIRRDLADVEAPVWSGQITHRADITLALGEGEGAQEYDANSYAAPEIARLWTAIENSVKAINGAYAGTAMHQQAA